MFKHHWNQTVFFDLEQGQNPNKKPKIVQLVREQIKFYRSEYVLISIFKDSEQNIH